MCLSCVPTLALPISNTLSGCERRECLDELCVATVSVEATALFVAGATLASVALFALGVSFAVPTGPESDVVGCPLPKGVPSTKGPANLNQT
jgi:hypothetical protein